MKYLILFSVLLMGLSQVCLADLPSAPPEPETLTLQDLVNRPDHWPATVTLPHDYRFSNGAVIHQGDAAKVIHFDGAKVLLITGNNIRFAATPADCSLLDAANQMWTGLTPAQKAVEPATLAADRSLWPMKVTIKQPISCQFGNLPPGTVVEVRKITPTTLEISWPHSPNLLNLPLDMTDVFDAARQLALLPPEKRPSPIAAALEKIMVDADGKPYHDDHLGDKKYFAFYYGASWCPPCRDFSPDLVKFADEALPKHPELTVVFLNDDPQPGQMVAYMKEEKMPFPAVPQKDLRQSSMLVSLTAKIIPEFIVVDRFGKILACNDDFHGNRGDPKDTVGVLRQMLEAPPAGQ